MFVISPARLIRLVVGGCFAVASCASAWGVDDPPLPPEPGIVPSRSADAPASPDAAPSRVIENQSEPEPTPVAPADPAPPAGPAPVPPPPLPPSPMLSPVPAPLEGAARDCPCRKGMGGAGYAPAGALAPGGWGYGYTEPFIPSVGGVHGRYPYYSYRRPWYPPGPVSANVTIIW